MGYLVGIDEAGYAPNLGPLVISATVWSIDDEELDVDLYKKLKGTVRKSPPPKNKSRQVAIADSKLLFKPPHGIAQLERGVLAALGLLGHCPADWDEIWRTLDVDTAMHLGLLPWHVDYELKLPLAADLEDLVKLCTTLRHALERAGVRLVAMRSLAVFPERFNDATDEHGNKGEALSKLTLQLLAEVLANYVDAPMLIICDRHGGRSRYGRLLQQQFPDPLIEVFHESSRTSVYRWGTCESRVEVRFCVGGESFLPVALASMTSKYLRELAMRAFNDFWRCRIPDLRPTAGYPGDSRRFKAAINAAQCELGIDDRMLWRAR